MTRNRKYITEKAEWTTENLHDVIVTSFILFFRITQSFKRATNWKDSIFFRLVTRGSLCPARGEIVVNAAFCSLHVSTVCINGISAYVFNRHWVISCYMNYLNSNCNFYLISSFPWAVPIPRFIPTYRQFSGRFLMIKKEGRTKMSWPLLRNLFRISERQNKYSPRGHLVHTNI